MHEEHQIHQGAHCLGEECPSGMRNRYFKRKNMTADDFNLEQRYGIERRRLLNRAIHGWGVAYGFKLEIETDDAGKKTGKLACSKGLALDRHGRELFRPEQGEIPAHQILLRDFNGDNGKEPLQCLLSAHYAERRMDPIRTGDSCGCRETEWNHVCETVVFSLQLLKDVCPSAESGCPTCSCLPENEAEGLARGEELPAVLDRGPHHCLCQWLTNKVIPVAPDRLQDCEGFKGFRIAIEDPVPLACVTISIDRCGHPVFENIDDACTPRRLVKTNDLLFDLIRGCDLTRIIEISWAKWHRKLKRTDSVPWEEFADMMAPTQDEYQPSGRRPLVITNFWIRFSAPVAIDTLTSDSVIMTVLAAEDEGGWIEVRRVPIRRLEPGSEGDFVDEVKLCVDAGWVKDEILGARSIFHRRGVRVEIEVRGDLILDCHGQTVDADAVGLRPVPTGNGTPGGTFISTFRVAPKREARIAAEPEE